MVRTLIQTARRMAGPHDKRGALEIVLATYMALVWMVIAFTTLVFTIAAALLVGVLTVLGV